MQLVSLVDCPDLGSEVTEPSGIWTDQIHWCCWEVVKINVSHRQREAMAVVWWHSHRCPPRVTAFNAFHAVHAFLLLQQYSFLPMSWIQRPRLAWRSPPSCVWCWACLWSLWEWWVPAQGWKVRDRTKALQQLGQPAGGKCIVPVWSPGLCCTGLRLSTCAVSWPEGAFYFYFVKFQEKAVSHFCNFSFLPVH